jgi:predicted NBD/HSP70 family sugar kinase
MPGWVGFPIRAYLEDLWGCPVCLNNSAELGALGEWAFGAGRNERNLAYIEVGTGVSAGLFLDGQVYRGATSSAGVIGHITIVENGPLCACGNYGCLDALVGAQAVALNGIAAVRRGQPTQLAQITPLDGLTEQDVIAAACAGDLAAQHILTEVGSRLGIAVASLVNLFNPGMVVVGGDLARTGEQLLEPIRQTVREHSLRAAYRAVRITTALLGNKSSAMGAVVQALTIALHQQIEKKEAKIYSNGKTIETPKLRAMGEGLRSFGEVSTVHHP